MGSVLMILIVFVIAGIISFWSYDFFSNKADQSLIDKECGYVSFVSGQFCKNTLSVDDLQGNSEYKTYLEFDARSDKNNISGFSILVNYGGNSILIPALEGDDLTKYSFKRVSSAIIEDSDEVDGITIIPKITINSIVYNCEDKSQDVSWEDIREC